MNVAMLDLANGHLAVFNLKSGLLNQDFLYYLELKVIVWILLL